MKFFKWAFWLTGFIFLSNCSPRQHSYACDQTTGSSCENLWLFNEYTRTTESQQAMKNFWTSKTVKIIDKPHEKYNTYQIELYLDDPAINFVMLIVKKGEKVFSIYKIGVCFKKKIEKAEARQRYELIKSQLIAPILK
jgi:1-acyl-sn-glycerol-3-phosphate acyltransferase